MSWFCATPLGLRWTRSTLTLVSSYKWQIIILWWNSFVFFFLWASGSINQAPCSHIQWAYRSVLKQWVEQSSNSPKGWCVASSQCERSHPVYREMATGGLPPAVHNRIFHGPTASYSKYTVGTSCFHISQIFSILSLLLSLIFGEKFRLRHFQSPQISKCWRFEGVSEVPPW